MRRISANYIIANDFEAIKNGIIEINDDNKILNIIKPDNTFESAKTEFYNGIIVPGFVNTHCHLELSYLKGLIPEKVGHIEFIKQIVDRIKNIPTNISDIFNADAQMQKEGIVAVGDISNTTNSAQIKKQSPIYYHTFIEIADFFNIEKGTENIHFAKTIRHNFEHSSIVAHAPYTCSPLFIEKTANENKDVYSIHNQETIHEDLMYLNGKSEIFDLIKKRKFSSKFQKTEKSSLKSYLKQYSSKDLKIILVHNLFTKEEDILFAEKENENIFWSFCPNSNNYIQGIKPIIDNFIKNNCKICLGTDSLASNKKLSIIEEMKNFINYNFIDVLKWATLNGAKALNIDDKYGSIEKEKTPGLNLITNFDFEKFQITTQSTIKVLA